MLATGLISNKMSGRAADEGVEQKTINEAREVFLGGELRPGD